MKYCLNYQNVKQRHKVSKCWRKNGTSRLAYLRVATDLQFVKKKKKNAISAKHNKKRWTCISCILTWAPESHFKNSFAFIHLTSSLHRICNLVPTHTWLLCRWGRITYLIYQCHLELLDLEWLFSSILNVIVNIKSDTLKWNFLKESLVPWAVIFVAVSRIKLSC